MSCVCGYQTYDNNGSGGILVAGSATVQQVPTRYFEESSGGVVCNGKATIETNQVFDGFSGVFHLIEDEGNYLDSTFRADGVSDITENQPTKTTSNLFAYSQTFDGNDFIQVPIDEAVDGYSITLWAKITGRFKERVFYSRGMKDSTEGYGTSIAIGHRNAGSFDTPEANRIFAKIQLQGVSNWTTYRIEGISDLTNDCWHHIAFVWTSGQNAKLYIDGALEKTTTISLTDLVPAENFIQFGRLNNQDFTEGELQEIRFTPEILSTDWINTEYLTMCNAAYVEGDEETPIIS